MLFHWLVGEATPARILRRLIRCTALSCREFDATFGNAFEAVNGGFDLSFGFWRVGFQGGIVFIDYGGSHSLESDFSSGLKYYHLTAALTTS